MQSPQDVSIGLLGLGTVGAGVYRLLAERQERIAASVGVRPVVKQILVQNREKARLGVDASLYAQSFEEIVNDPDIQVVVEVIGGQEPAYRFATEALNRGKHVVMANKELMATHG